ncbi:hypothetical protein DRJ22_06260 [Candidatus Woesearchaeota archaeon]|nr:MAG: hypothetical protein DRJ22_06260 [Candidatus Woesearchaeota archaeon]
MKICVIGGGTGSFTALKGLKKYTNDITAIVSMFDNGGSTGILRDELGILPPGDARRCLLALADETEDNIFRKLFLYRFKNSVQNHSFGNLFLAALTEITGGESEAIKTASKILRIKGKVVPVSLNNSNLCVKLENGETIKGETLIDIPRHDGNLKIVNAWLEPEAKANQEAIKEILKADKIIIGPGDLFSSIIPNFLAKGIPEAIQQSKAKKIYICNLMTKHGETTNFTAADHLKEIIKYSTKPDAIICNSMQPEENLLKKYAKEKKYPVKIDEKEIQKLGVNIITKEVACAKDFVRHDSDKLAKTILNT